MTQRLTICLLTYNRFDYAERTLKSVLENIETEYDLCVHIASDGDPIEYIEKLKWIAGCYNVVQSVSHSISNRRGYGGNYNAATNIIHNHSDFILPLEDDWELVVSNWNVDRYMNDLNELGNGFGSIRLGYVGWSFEQLATFIGVNFRTYLHLLPESKNQYVFSGHPRIETRAYERRVGLWPEGLSPGLTELSVGGRVAAREGILVPFGETIPFRHFGDIKSQWEVLSASTTRT